jgi:hypothetical protein
MDEFLFLTAGLLFIAVVITARLLKKRKKL